MSTGWFLATAALSLCLSWTGAHRAPRVWLVAVLVASGSALLAAGGLWENGLAWEWHSAFRIGGERLHLRLDGLSAFFLALVAIVSGLGAIYSVGYWPDRRHPITAPAGRSWWSALGLGMGLVLLCSNGLHFLIAWEAFAVSAFFLISLERRRREVQEAGWLYLAASHAGTLALFAFFSLMAARTGSWDLGPMREQAGLAPLFWLALVGFGLKAGLFPLHIWLPSAHANAPSHVSAIMSGVAIKMGIYGLVRFSGWLPLPAAAGWVVAGLGLASAVLGVAFALGQHDLKRLLAYHSVENIGIILLGLGFAMVAAQEGRAAWGRLALAGSLLHVWNHGLFKSLLFLGAGSVMQATGTREMSRLGGLWSSMPWTASLFALGSVAIAGLPPLNGFVSEWLLYLGLFDAVQQPGTVALGAVVGMVLLAVTGALALACFVKVCGVVYLGAPRTEAAVRARECGMAMRGPMLVLAGGCIAIGVAPAFFWPVLREAMGAWREEALAVAAVPPPLVALGGIHLTLVLLALGTFAWLWRRSHRSDCGRAVTWDCGYAAPDARMQYTAGSFARILTGWFDWILLTERHQDRPQGLFPTRATSRAHTPETVLKFLFKPAARAVMTVSGFVRRFQHGRVQSYLFYLILGLAALAALALAGGAR